MSKFGFSFSLSRLLESHRQNKELREPQQFQQKRPEWKEK